METRATETTTANITNFLVTAINASNSNFFTDQAFTKAGSYFTSNPAYYWPNDGSNLSFFAYSPSATDLGATISITSASKTMTNFSPAAAIASQKDFITASATGSKANESTGVADVRTPPRANRDQSQECESRLRLQSTGRAYRTACFPSDDVRFRNIGVDARNDEEQLRGDLYFGENPERYGRFDHGDGRQ